MQLEIERKFLVRDSAVIEGHPGRALQQGYLPCEPPVSVRVRIDGDQGWLTIKQGKDAAQRQEYEYAIPLGDARLLLASVCGTTLVRKQRHRIEHAGRIWEVDRFEDDNAGLLLAEIELERIDAPLELPPWVGAEVTADVRLLNSSLAQRPWSHWPADERAALLDAQQLHAELSGADTAEESPP